MRFGLLVARSNFIKFQRLSQLFVEYSSKLPRELMKCVSGGGVGSVGGCEIPCVLVETSGELYLNSGNGGKSGNSGNVIHVGVFPVWKSTSVHNRLSKVRL